MGLVGSDSGAWLGLLDALRSHARSELTSAAPIWIGVNGARVDARLRDGGGREHHVVAFVTDGATNVVEVISEPDDLSPVTPLALVVNGPAGSGKSSVLQAIAHAATEPWVVFDEPTIGAVDPQFLVWPGRVPHLAAGMLAGIAALASSGVRVGIAAGGRSQEQFRAAFDGVRMLFVGLDCDAATLRRREEGRDGRWGGLAEQSSHAHHGWSYDLRFDSTTTLPEGIAAAISSSIATLI